MRVDAHVHLPSDRCTPRAFIEASVANLLTSAPGSARASTRRKNLLVDAYLANMQDHSGDQFVSDMDAAGISHAVLLAPDFTFALGGATTYEDIVRIHEAALRRHPGRLSYLCGPDPRWGPDGLSLLERALDQPGCVGVKLYPPCGYSPSDPMLDPYYELCSARNLPVLLHTGPTSPVLSFEWSNPIHVDRAARRFPRVSFVLAHAAVHHVDDAVGMAGYRPNVYLDCSGYAAATHVGGGQALATLFSKKIAHKVLFGTDWPLFAMNQSYATIVDLALGAGGPVSDLSLSDSEWLLSGNARRVFHLAMLPEEDGARAHARTDAAPIGV